MPTYSFLCDGCGREEERVQAMSDDHAPGVCLHCGRGMRRLYQAAFSCDEIRSTSYVAPPRRKGEGAPTVKDHGRVFDIGMGAYYSSWSERKRLMKAKGLKEYGGPAHEV